MSYVSTTRWHDKLKIELKWKELDILATVYLSSSFLF